MFFIELFYLGESFRSGGWFWKFSLKIRLKSAAVSRVSVFGESADGGKAVRYQCPEHYISAPPPSVI